MRKFILMVGLLAGFVTCLTAGDTLRLKVETDRELVLKDSPQDLVVKIDLSSLARKRVSRTPLNLAIVLDRSGSMSGAKIENAREAAMQIVDQLEPEDHLALVAYSDKADVLIPSRPVENKEDIKRKIAGIRTGGSTALYDGVNAGAEQVKEHFSDRRINRVLLLSDGIANVGPSSTPALRRLGGTLSERGIAVTTIGLGGDYNEDLMAALAEASDANYYYVKDIEKLPEIFARELGELRAVAARNLEIEVVCPEGVKPAGFIGRPEKFEGQHAVVRFSHVILSQNRFLLLQCRVTGAQTEVVRVKVRYRDELNGGVAASASESARIRLTDDGAAASQSVRAEIVTQTELMLAAAAKDKAVADADAGRYQDAARSLNAQAERLNRQYQNAPAAMQSQVRVEVQNLQQRAADLGNNQYDAASRKGMQSESWSFRNSKSY
jgi:Ca-activated chloride channel family protein